MAGGSPTPGRVYHSCKCLSGAFAHSSQLLSPFPRVPRLRHRGLLAALSFLLKKSRLQPLGPRRVSVFTCERTAPARVELPRAWHCPCDSPADPPQLTTLRKFELEEILRIT